MRIIERYSSNQPEVLEIIKAQYIGDFAIRIVFNDGKRQLVDFKPFLELSQHPSVKKYLNEDIFSRFKIVHGNLDWNNYELNFPIADLYQNSVLHTVDNPN